MKRNIYVKLLLAIFAMVTLVGCGPDVEKPENVVQLPDNQVEHTLIMYLNADNNLSSSIYRNAEDAEQGMIGAMPSTRLIVYLDTAKDTRLYEVYYLSYGANNHVRYCKELKSYPNQISTTPEVMKSVLEDIKELAPSLSYGLVMAGHGSGWFPKPSAGVKYNDQKVAPIDGVGKEYDFLPYMQMGQTRYLGYDTVYNEDGSGTIDNEKSFANAAEIVEGLSPIHFDYIIFDACFMSSVEFLYEVRSAADYIVASPVEIMACGLAYKEIVSNLMSRDHNVASIGDVVYDVYMRDDNFSRVKSLALATIDCSKLDALADAVRDVVASTGIENCVEMVESLLQPLVLDGRTTANWENVQPLDRMMPAAFNDLEDFVQCLTDDDELLNRFYAALDAAVVANVHTANIFSVGQYYDYDFLEYLVDGKFDICGVSTYIPRRKSPKTLECYLQTSWAKKVYGLE
ncbi:MAG: hypothetical protein II323_01475 [Tidjanibacter sp.]|nr:hypothetical protein [Tidjanibacter sp.]